jgi:transposase
MKPKTRLLQDIKTMRFEEAHTGWKEGRLTQEEAARILGICDRSFRRYINRYEENGLEGLIDKRLEQISHRKAPVDEVLAVVDRYRNRYQGWNVKHFFKHYREEGGKRSYSWIKNTLQQQGVMKVSKSKGKHRKRRERSPLPGMMIHQDGSTHQWIEGQCWDLIVTMDDATNEHYSMFFVEQEGTQSSLQGVTEIIESKGIFCSFYSDRGSHYWHTPEAGGKVDKIHLTQFGRAMAQLGIHMIAAYSPEARGRSERMFRTHQDRLVKELSLHQITDMERANQYLKEHYLPRFNEEFQVPAMEKGSAFIPCIGINVKDILCEQYERQVGKDNCVQFEGLCLQIPADKHRMHYVKAKVRVHRYVDGTLSIFHGPRRLADYIKTGELMEVINMQQAA